MATPGIHVEIDPAAGFCHGVQRAVRLAEETLAGEPELYCAGDIVHNEMELARLQKKGLIPVDMGRLKDFQGKSVLFRAHGEPPASYHMAKKQGHRVVDATCPVVVRLQKRIRDVWEQGGFVVIYGKPCHPEVIGLNGQIDNKGVVVDSAGDVLPARLPKEVHLFSQTTRSVEGLYELAGFLRRAGKKVVLHDSICRRVANRMASLKEFARKHDKIVFVGGKKSANARLLADICRQENALTYFIGSPDELQKGWFSPGDSVGVSGATSTPPWLLERVANAIGQIRSPKRSKNTE